MKIAWLMLSLSFRFHSVCPDVTTARLSTVPAGPSPTSAGRPSSTQPTVNSTTASSAGPNGGAVNITQTQPQPSTINPPSSTHISNSSAPSSAANPTATFGTTKATIPAATTVTTATAVTAVTTATAVTAVTTVPAVSAVSAGSSVGSYNAVQKQTPEASVSSKTSVTELSVTPGNHYYVETKTTTTKVSTDATAGQQSVSHPATTFKTSNRVEKTEKTTVPLTRTGQTASRATEPPTGKPGTSSALPILATTGPPVPDNLSETTHLQTATYTVANTQPQSEIFQYSLNSRHEKEKDNELVEVCKRLMANFEDGNCTLIWRHNNGKVQFDCVEINGKVKTSLTAQYYEEISKKPPDNKTLIAILASCGALLVMIFILAICASHHRRPFNENQQHLTEELHTVENGYHDNPTLEVMEVQAEMQEKKVALNGEFNDSWIVPIDNLLKEDLVDEEDTHL